MAQAGNTKANRGHQEATGAATSSTHTTEWRCIGWRLREIDIGPVPCLVQAPSLAQLQTEREKETGQTETERDRDGGRGRGCIR